MKLFIAIFLLLSLTSCINTNRGDGWTKDEKDGFLEGCTSYASVEGMNAIQTHSYCQCILKETMREYPYPEQIEGALPQDFVEEVGIKCLGKIGLLGNN